MSDSNKTDKQTNPKADKYRPLDWQELNLGGVLTEAGNSADYETGTWRTWRPVWQAENCIHCLTCWVFCPENAFMIKDGATRTGKARKEINEINYYYCKGCGLCVKECPINKKGDKTALDYIQEET